MKNTICFQMKSVKIIPVKRFLILLGFLINGGIISVPLLEHDVNSPSTASH